MSHNDDKYVCRECFSDEYLQAFIDHNLVEMKCSFCKAEEKEPIAAPLDEVAEFIGRRLLAEYDLAANNLPYESSEGGWQGQYWDTWDLLHEAVGIDLPNDRNSILLKELVDLIGMDDWCERNPFSLNDDQTIRFSWGHFCNVVKHDRRFFLSDYRNAREDSDVLQPLDVLERIFAYAEHNGLMSLLPTGSILFRAREQPPDRTWSSALDLGPPSNQEATQSNRMNPPGIAAMYASDNEVTCLRETANHSGTFVVARFETLVPVAILDLTRLPSVPSVFYDPPDSVEIDPRFALKFLHHVVEAMSRPVARDDRVHIEYIPTQVVGEYIRLKHTYDGQELRGILYPSAVHPGHASIVLFISKSNVLADRGHATQLELAEEDIKIVQLAGFEAKQVSARSIRQWAREGVMY